MSKLNSRGLTDRGTGKAEARKQRPLIVDKKDIPVKQSSGLPKVVYKVDPITYQILEEYPSAREAGRLHHIAENSISKVCRGEQKLAGGYKWEYKDEPFDN